MHPPTHARTTMMTPNGDDRDSREGLVTSASRALRGRFFFHLIYSFHFANYVMPAAAVKKQHQYTNYKPAPPHVREREGVAWHN
jgi:hypothetical protein